MDFEEFVELLAGAILLCCIIAIGAVVLIELGVIGG